MGDGNPCCHRHRIGGALGSCSATVYQNDPRRQNATSWVGQGLWWEPPWDNEKTPREGQQSNILGGTHIQPKKNEKVRAESICHSLMLVRLQSTRILLGVHVTTRLKCQEVIPQHGWLECGDPYPIFPIPDTFTTVNNPLHKSTTRAGALVTSTILPGWKATRVGPGQNPQYTRASQNGGRS